MNGQVIVVTQVISAFFEVVGIAAILTGFALAVRGGVSRARLGDGTGAYEAVRSTFGRSILLGLEILVAADLVRTVAVQPTLPGLAVLAALVGIRTFLSWSLEVEIDGRWPWQRRRETA